MLSNQEFEDWCCCLNLPQATRKIIEQIRSTEPIRRVNTSGINVKGALWVPETRSSVHTSTTRLMRVFGVSRTI